MNHPWKLLLGLGLLLALLASCESPERDTLPEGSEGTLYRPPTQAATPTRPLAALTTPGAQPEGGEAPGQLAPTPSCTDSLRYLEDLSIPDGTIVQAGDPLDKQWRVENSGTCNWDAGYHLKLITGPDLGLPVEQALYPARGGTETTIRMLIDAPQEPGVYRSAWQAYNPAGEPFGDPVFIEFVVSVPSP